MTCCGSMSGRRCSINSQTEVAAMTMASTTAAPSIHQDGRGGAAGMPAGEAIAGLSDEADAAGCAGDVDAACGGEVGGAGYCRMVGKTADAAGSSLVTSTGCW